MQVDHTVEEIMQALEKLGVEENTLVIFASDNGPVWFKEDIQKFSHRSAGKFRGMKLDAYEGGHRSPFIARWPGKIQPNSSSSHLISFTDMLSTFAAVVGDTLSPDASRDSYSLLPVFLGQGLSGRKGLVVEGHTVREGEWKLIFGSGAGPLHRNFGNSDAPAVEGELYNLKQDPYETNNLYERHPEKVQELTKRMQQYRSEGSVLHVPQSHK
jgi:arylsulfatase A-like enzyme